MTGSWRDALGQPGIRALLLAWLLSLVSTFSLMVAAPVYAYQRGGAALVVVYGIVSTAPGAVLTPMLMSLAASTRGDRVLRLTTWLRAVLVAGAAVTAVSGDAPVVVIVLAALATSLGSTFRPTQAVLLPWLARTPAELTAGNVAATASENAAALSGPLVAGALIAWFDPAATMAVAATFMGLAAVALRGLDVAPPRRGRVSRVRVGTLARQMGAGSLALLRVAPPAGIVVLALAQTFVRGALLVLLILFTLETLDLEESAVGWLSAAIGLGGLVGAAVASRAVRLTRLGRCLTAGVLLWGLGVLALSAAQGPVVAFAALAVVGLGNTLEDASAFTLMPRLLGPRVAGPALGAFELVVLTGMGSGALAAPAVADWLGVRGALALLGGSLCGLTVLYLLAFVRVDRTAPAPPAQVGMLRSLPMFASLPIVVVEELADALEENRFDAGETVLAEGRSGDRYHLITDGTATVHVRGVRRRTLGPGEGFGEIALLRGVPRTATVTAGTSLTTMALDRSAFLDAVSVSRTTRRQLEAVADLRLAEDPDERAGA